MVWKVKVMASGDSFRWLRNARRPGLGLGLGVVLLRLSLYTLGGSVYR